MKEKCQKYEGLFVFSDDETFQKHVQECEDCKKEHEKMEQVSNLISEVKFYYKAKKRYLKKLKAICAVFILLLFSTTFCIITFDDDIKDTLMYGETLTAEELGFPVDSYGLIMVD